jgi:hypothetical protein
VGDYNWFSKDAVQVAVEGLREEAGTWHDLSSRMDKVRALAEAQTLQSSAFSVIDVNTSVTGLDLYDAYTKMQQQLVTLFKQATVEFDKFGEALYKCAVTYEHADENAAQDFDAIARTM